MAAATPLAAIQAQWLPGVARGEHLLGDRAQLALLVGQRRGQLAHLRAVAAELLVDGALDARGRGQRLRELLEARHELLLPAAALLLDLLARAGGLVLGAVGELARLVLLLLALLRGDLGRGLDVLATAGKK